MQRSTTLVLGTILLGFVPAPPRTAAQTLVKDIYLGEGLEPSSYPSPLLTTANRIYFQATTAAHGTELWTTDGTSGGTTMLADLFPGGPSSKPRDLVQLPNGAVLFLACSSNDGPDLWRTDGTPNGTVLVRQLGPAAHGLVVAGNDAFFYHDDGSHGFELWRSDGTAAGTALVTEIVPGPGGISAGTSRAAPLGGVVCFEVRSSANSWALWRSDGTGGGTFKLADFLPSTTEGLGDAAVVNGILFFATGGVAANLWRTDATVPGTAPIVPSGPGANGAAPRFVGALGGELLFSANPGAPIFEELYKTDGTAAGTQLVKDIHPAGSSAPALVGALGGRLVLAATTPAEGRELWISDGTSTGTAPLSDIFPGGPSSAPGSGVTMGGKLFFGATTAGAGVELLSTDGTPSGTSLVADIDPSGDGLHALLGSVGATLLFGATDGTSGEELWKSDGSGPGTSLLVNINPGQTSEGSYPRYLTRFGDTLIFVAHDELHGAEIWQSDGTSAGTILLKDTVPGPIGWVGYFGIDIVTFDDWFYFDANGYPWVSDGTTAGTQPLGTSPSDVGYLPRHAVRIGDRVVYAATHGTLGRELWITDGTHAGTTLLADIHQGEASSSPDGLVTHAGRVFFTASDGIHGREPWVTDGTTAGTTLLRDIHPTAGSIAAGKARFVESGNVLCFAANDGLIGVELWTTDGTTLGTTVLKDTSPGPDSGSPSQIAPFGDHVLFFAKNELWVSDGTPSGTVVVPGGVPAGGYATSPPVANDSIAVYRLNVGATAFLYATDGTAAGTGPLKQLQSQQVDRVAQGDELLFAGAETSDFELWVTTGTATSTKTLLEVGPGGISSAPSEFTRVGDLVFFSADDGAAGRELHAIPLVDTGSYVSESFGSGCPGSGGLVPQIRTSGDVAVGSTFTVHLDDALPGATAILFAGPAASSLPLGGGCTFYVGTPAVSLAVAVSSTGSTVLSSSPAPALFGQRAALQFVVLDPAGAALGQASATGGLELLIGS